MNVGGEHGEGLVGAQAVEARLAVAVFNALHQAGLADFDVLVEVGAGDGQELDPLQQRVGGVLGFFEHTPVELHPGVVPAVEELLFLSGSSHRVRPVRRVGSLQRFRGKNGKSLAWSHQVPTPSIQYEDGTEMKLQVKLDSCAPRALGNADLPNLSAMAVNVFDSWKTRLRRGTPSTPLIALGESEDAHGSRS